MGSVIIQVQYFVILQFLIIDYCSLLTGWKLKKRLRKRRRRNWKHWK